MHCGNRGISLEELNDKSRQYCPNDLRSHVWQYIFSLALAAQPDAQRDGRIEVPSGNMPARKNHHHERGTDCQRGERTGTLADDRAPNGQNQKKVPINSAPYLFINNLLRLSIETSSVTAIVASARVAVTQDFGC
jgi:hypothetical protein